jgi:tripartite-type tricarboxylate transporter receptor subunit TctC
MLLRIAAWALWLCAIAPPVSAADYPDHAIKMIVPFAAGGGTDVLARIIAQNLNSTRKTSTANGVSRSSLKISRAHRARSAPGR